MRSKIRRQGTTKASYSLLAWTPWQNGTAERCVGSCRREILDQIIALNEPHLRWLIRDYVDYHQERPGFTIPSLRTRPRRNRRTVQSQPFGRCVISYRMFVRSWSYEYGQCQAGYR